jgi:ferritin dps family protein|nr:MAG TPA: DPS protein [Caudoviricetes sp.]
MARTNNDEQQDALNILLATIEVAAANVKGRHWLVSGTHFRSLHLEFDDVWKTLLDAADKVAETQRVIGGIPSTGMAEFIAESIIKEDSQVVGSAELMVERTRNELNVLIESIHSGVREDFFDPTTENDVLNISSALRHHILFLDGFLANWKAAV